MIFGGMVVAMIAFAIYNPGLLTLFGGR